MIGELINHLWQSTLFALAVGLLTVGFRKNRAQIRYWLWFSASFKFFIPFALLIKLGRHLEWFPTAKKIAAPAVSFTMEQITEPFPDSFSFVSTSGTTDWARIALLGVWLCGFGVIALIRLQGWLHIRAAIRSSVPLKLPTAVKVRSSPGLLEPGVVGLLRPILLLPEGIVECMTPLQLEAVLAHELCHVRRRDNLTSALHMVAEATFWFHPLLWWISGRLVEERERACDEDVLRLGSEPQVYAEAILNVCKYYLESPLVCVSGISGADLKKRIDAIMAHHLAQSLNLAKKLLLVAGGLAAVAAPIAIGLLHSPSGRAQSPLPHADFNVVSVKPSAPDDHNTFMIRPQPGGLIALGTPLKMLVMEAYNVKAFQVSGGPSWIGTERWDILAKAEGLERPMSMVEIRPMLQALLGDRFELKVHKETNAMPVFVLEVEQNGPKLAPHTGTEQQTRSGNGSIIVKKGRISGLAAMLSRQLGRVVIDKTELKGEYDYALQWTPDPGQGGPESMGLPPNTPTLPPSTIHGPQLFAAVQEQLGLRLVSQTGPVDFIVIDSVGRPSVN